MSGKSKQLSASAAAALIKDRDIVSISSSSGLGCPDLVLAAIGERFRQHASPLGLTLLQPISAGDMYGIKGVDHLAQDGLIEAILAGSFPSGPSSLPMPAIWQMILANQVRAYNVPSGILFDMHRDAAARRPGVLTKVGLGTFVDPELQGCAMNAAAAAHPIVQKVQFDGDEFLYFRAIAPQVAIIRATTADQRGNLSYEHEGAFLGALDQAIAARNNGGIVIAQVKRIVQGGSIAPQQVHVPGTLVDYLVLAPDQLQTTQTVYDPAISGEIRCPNEVCEALPWSVEKLIARRAAQELWRGNAVNLGFGIAANVPRIVLEEGLHGQLSWVIEQGAVGGIPLTGFAFGCAINADAIIPSPSQFSYFQGGGFDVSLLSFLQIDGDGSVNVSRLAEKPYLTAGCGGFVDITAHARRLVFCGFFSAGAVLEISDGRLHIVREGRVKKLVGSLDQKTFNGCVARQRAQQVLYVTERCVMQLTETGLQVIEIAPGVDLQRDILAMADCPLHVSPALRLMDADLFQPLPFGLRLRESGHA